MFIPFKKLGLDFIDWGITSESAQQAIKSLSDDKLEICLLAAVVDRLFKLELAIDRLRYETTKPKPKSRPSHNIADGMQIWLLTSLGDKPIKEMDKSNLSVRAMKTLYRSGFTMRSQITPDSLYEIQGCGPTTVNELMNWVEGRENDSRS